MDKIKDRGTLVVRLDHGLSHTDLCYKKIRPRRGLKLHATKHVGKVSISS